MSTAAHKTTERELSVRVAEFLRDKGFAPVDENGKETPLKEPKERFSVRWKRERIARIYFKDKERDASDQRLVVELLKTKHDSLVIQLAREIAGKFQVSVSTH